VILGLFILVGVVVVVAALFSIGTFRQGFRQRIEVSATLEEVKGLKSGDAVWYAGVGVGTVKNVGFAEGAGVRVDMRIDHRAAEHIPNDALARIGSDSLIGNSIVVLYDGSPGKKPLVDGTTLAAGESVTPEAMMAEFQKSNENLLVITDNLREVSTRLVNEEGTIGRLLADDTLYTDLETTLQSLQVASDNARVLTADVKAFTAELNTEGNLPHDLMTDQSIHASLVASTESLEKATKDAEELLDELKAKADDPNTPAGVLLNDAEAGADVAETLKNLQESSVLLEEDLKALQQNFLLRGYFRKKAKREEKEQRKKEREAKKEQKK
jgi:phospholipid/cholesterol/gamma-HCH transport system substrate-binding protein